ncbi:MAG: hypothetical protein JSW58_05525 [Candidatus Latescibacterota bacterium]|nr:MAG: hypothetical protein JSW58_05525 [Candidatus Latescibacterota bacterium]
MRLNIKVVLSLVVLATLLAIGCTRQNTDVTELKSYPLDDAAGVLAKSGVEVDDQVTSDGNGSLRLTADQPTTFRLLETGDLDIENARLLYRASMRTKDVDGQVYLEMWCHFPGKGEYFSRGLHSSLSGTVAWTTQETPFFLKKGENPDNVKLNVVVDGKGTVWIDDIKLVRGSL